MGKEPPIPKELWDQIPSAAQAALLVLFQQYEGRIAQLEQCVRELEQRLRQNSSNSSRPPSTDAPTVKRPPPKPPSGRSRGGQPTAIRPVPFPRSLEYPLTSSVDWLSRSKHNRRLAPQSAWRLLSDTPWHRWLPRCRAGRAIPKASEWP